MKQSYWYETGKYQEQLQILHDLIDAYLETFGKVPYRYPHLERLRKTKNAYYRLFNDGDANARLLGVYAGYIDADAAHETADKAIDAAIEAAWKETCEK